MITYIFALSSAEKYTAVLQQTSNRYWHIPASDGTEWLCMGDSTLSDAVYDDTSQGGEEQGQGEGEGEEVRDADTDTLESDPGTGVEFDAFGRPAPRATVTVSRRIKPKTTNVVTVHTIPTTASAARADLQQKKFRSNATPTGTPPITHRNFEIRPKKSSLPSSNYSSKYIEDGS